MTAKSLSNNSRRIAFFAGSFDPFTVGHASVVERALAIFDAVIIGVGVNSLKAAVIDAGRRAKIISAFYESNPDVSVMTYEGLTADAALSVGACCLLRGVCSVKDFEYERDMADVNRQLSGLETVLIYSLPEHSAVSSSVVRELQAYGKDISAYLPQK